MDQETSQIKIDVLILPFGDRGTTRKAAEKLAAFLGGADIFEEPPNNFEGYRCVVFGANVRFGKLNKRFLKFVKKRREELKVLPVYLYVVGVEIEKSQKYIDLAKKSIPSARGVRYVWGELKTEGATSFEKFFLSAYIDGRHDEKLPKPRLLDKELRLLSEEIKQKLSY